MRKEARKAGKANNNNSLNNNSNNNNKTFKMNDKLRTALCAQGQFIPELLDEIFESSKDF